MRYTLAHPSTHQVEIKQSRFLAQVWPVVTAQQALEIIDTTSKIKATHHCWAYRIDPNQYRFNDDGEPAGTAGQPILAAIDGQLLDQTLVIVTRWYGGIKLGAGGLVRAYGNTAAECLRTAERIALIPTQILHIDAQFEDIGTLHALLGQSSAQKLSEVFTEYGVCMQIEVNASEIPALLTRIRDATRDRAQTRVADD